MEGSLDGMEATTGMMCDWVFFWAGFGDGHGGRCVQGINRKSKELALALAHLCVPGAWNNLT